MSDGETRDPTPDAVDESGSGITLGPLATAYRWWRRLTAAAAILSGTTIFALMLFIVTDVVRRNLTGGSIPGSFEIAEKYFMPVAVFPALAYVYGTGVLPRMELVRDRLPAAVRTATAHALLAVELVVLALVVYYTWGYAEDARAREVAFPAGGSLYTQWPLFYLVPLAFLMLLVETLFVVVRNLTSGPVGLSMQDVDHDHEPARV